MRIAAALESRCSGDIEHGCTQHRSADGGGNRCAHNCSADTRAHDCAHSQTGPADATADGPADTTTDSAAPDRLRRTREPMELQLLRRRDDQLPTLEFLRLLQLHPVVLAVNQGVRGGMPGRRVLPLGRP